MTFDFQDGNGPVPAHRHPNGGGWVADTARVSGNALVYGNAQVSGTAWVSQSHEVAAIGPLGRDRRFLTLYPTRTGHQYVTGCFVGTYRALRKACLRTHGRGTPHDIAYGSAARALWLIVFPGKPFPKVTP